MCGYEDEDHESGAWAVAVTALGVLAAGFVLVERHAVHPLAQPAAWRAPLLRWGAFGSFFNTATTSSSITVATLYLQDQLGLAPLRTAALLVTFSVPVVVGSLGAPRLVSALGWGRALAGGLGIVAAGNILLVVWPHVIGVGVAAGICGLGIGIGSVAATDMAPPSGCSTPRPNSAPPSERRSSCSSRRDSSPAMRGQPQPASPRLPHWQSLDNARCASRDSGQRPRPVKMEPCFPGTDDLALR